METRHQYSLDLSWTGNNGRGTESYRSYERSYTISKLNKPIIEGSSDPAFLGDPKKYNPEELLLAAISSCHMLWYLHLCAVQGIVVLAYRDSAIGAMIESKNNAGRFAEVTLRPLVTVIDSAMIPKANALHREANASCYIANSLNFPVSHQPECIAAQ